MSPRQSRAGFMRTKAALPSSSRERTNESRGAALPNFLIIGAAKAGTTSLYHYLGQHPQVYMSPVKEPKFFALEGQQLDYRGPGDAERMKSASVTTLQDYQELFEGVSTEIAVGEASTLYLYSEKASASIKHHLPEVKLIAVLRNPVDRAYSNFLYLVRDGIEQLNDFSQALEAEESRIRGRWAPMWHYRQRGFYYLQMKRYFDLFDASRIKVVLYEDMRAGLSGLLSDIFRFLGVDSEFAPDTSKAHNVSGVPRVGALHNLLVRPNVVKDALKPLFAAKIRTKARRYLRNKNLAKQDLPWHIRIELLEGYREDILQLETLIQRDLSGWLEPQTERRA